MTATEALTKILEKFELLAGTSAPLYIYDEYKEYDEAFRIVNINDWTDYVDTSAEFMRPSEVDLLIGDYSKASSELNWTPKTSFSELVKMMVQSDLERCSRSR